MILGQPLSNIFDSGRLLWSAKIGRMHYRNSILTVGNDVFVSSAGNVWNEEDPSDGIYAINISSGDRLWHAATMGDANEIVALGKTIIGATDLGQVFAIDASTGEFQAMDSFTGPVFSKPVLVQSSQEQVAVLLSYSGDVIIFEPSKAAFRIAGRVRGDFRANPVTNASMAAVGQFIVGSESGEIMKLMLEESSVKPFLLHQLYSRSSSDSDFILSFQGIGSLVVEGNNLIVSYIRDTYDKEPPIVCIDLSTGVEKWHARAVKTISKKLNEYGNVRVRPLIRDGMIYCTFGYNDSLHAFSLSSGRGSWKVKLDDGLFQNWASPINGPGSSLFVPRVNGVVHQVDIETRKVVNTISAEIGRYISNRDYYRRKRQFGEDSWHDTSPIASESILHKRTPNTDDILDAGIAATPLYTNGLLLVGGVSGALQAYRL